MTRITATLRGGRIEPAEPIDLPEGTRLQVEYAPAEERIGLDESEWRDDAEALADWAAWLATIEPVAFAEDGEFEERFRRHNVEAVRQQMAGGLP